MVVAVLLIEPSVTSKVTFCPSLRGSKPFMVIALK